VSAPEVTPAVAFVELIADAKALADLVWLALAEPDNAAGRGLLLLTGQLAEIETAGLALAGTTPTN
jgi:hypothetical protein